MKGFEDFKSHPAADELALAHVAKDLRWRIVNVELGLRNSKRVLDQPIAMQGNRLALISFSQALLMRLAMSNEISYSIPSRAERFHLSVHDFKNHRHDADEKSGSGCFHC